MADDFTPKPLVNGVVHPAELYHPGLMGTTWCKVWALKCGRCGHDFHRFSWFGKPKCPYCGTRNVPDLITYF